MEEVVGGGPTFEGWSGHEEGADADFEDEELVEHRSR